MQNSGSLIDGSKDLECSASTWLPSSGNPRQPALGLAAVDYIPILKKTATMVTPPHPF